MRKKWKRGFPNEFLCLMKQSRFHGGQRERDHIYYITHYILEQEGEK